MNANEVNFAGGDKKSCKRPSVLKLFHNSSHESIIFASVFFKFQFIGDKLILYNSLYIGECDSKDSFIGHVFCKRMAKGMKNVDNLIMGNYFMAFQWH